MTDIIKLISEKKDEPRIYVGFSATSLQLLAKNGSS